MATKTFLGLASAAATATILIAAVPATAQERISVDMPNNGFVVDTSARGSGEGQFYGLPGVDTRDGVGKSQLRGPGGLQNNVGAIGTATPSTSSANPTPLQRDTATTGGGIPFGR